LFAEAALNKAGLVPLSSSCPDLRYKWVITHVDEAAEFDL